MHNLYVFRSIDFMAKGWLYSKEKPCSNASALQKALTLIESSPLCHKTVSYYIGLASLELGMFGLIGIVNLI